MGKFVGFTALCPTMERCPCDLGEVTAYHDESLQSFEVEPRVQLTQKARYSTLQHIVNDPYSRHIKEIKHIHVSKPSQE